MVIGGLASVSAMYLVEQPDRRLLKTKEQFVDSTILIILITIALLVLALIAFSDHPKAALASGRCGDAAGPSSLDLHWSPFSTTTHRVIARLSRDDAQIC